MNVLGDFGISAWSWLNALGSESWAYGDTREATRTPLQEILQRTTLRSHQAELGIPGYSGRVEGELRQLPPSYRKHESRCARLVYQCLLPLLPQLEKARARYGEKRIAIVLGSSTGGIDATEVALGRLRIDRKLPVEYDFENEHPYNILLTIVAGVSKIAGPAYVVSTACSSGGKALGIAQRLLHSGYADAVLTGGADALCEMTIRGFAGLGVLSEERCRPFTKERSGISIGEGAALVLLERETESEFSLLGVGESSDAYHATTPHPEGMGAILAMRRCLTIAGLEAQDVDYVNAHGTGTVTNDLMETKAIQEVLGGNTPFSSTKHKTGHQLGTAGTTEAIFCLQALRDNNVPSNISPLETDDSLALQPQLRTTQLNLKDKAGERGRVALSNSFAFGGSNVSVGVGWRCRSPSPRPNPLPLHKCFIRGLALWSPYDDSYQAWTQRIQSTGAEVRSNEGPTASLLSPRARGRASLLTRMYADIFSQLQHYSSPPCFDASKVPTIYVSAYGEMETTMQLLEQLGEKSKLSPMRFHSSVHNTASGRISLATKNRAYSTALAAGNSGFAMALIEAQSWLSCHGGEVVVLVADAPIPAILLDRPTFAPLALGLHLSHTDAGDSFEISSPEPTSTTIAKPIEPSRLPLPVDLCDAPPAWGMALFDAIATACPGEVVVGPRHSVRLRVK